MQLLCLDFETYFADDYSLSKLTTEEYVRSGKFLAHGCGVRFPDGQIIWMNEATFRQWTRTVDWTQTAVVMQHAQFDSLILSFHYNVYPAMIFCTIAMANIVLPHNRKSLAKLAQYFNLPEKNVPYHLFKNRRYLPPDIEYQVGEGCRHDVWLNWEIFSIFMRGDPSRNLPPFPRGELVPMSTTLQMFSSPVVCIDVLRAEALSERIAARKATMLKSLAQSLWPHRFALGGNMPDAEVVEIMRTELASREAFADILRGLGIEPPVKMNKKGDKLTLALAKNDPGMKALLESDNELVVAVCAAKLGVASTINETRARRFGATGRRGQPVPVYLNYNSTFSGRTGGGDKMNWGNLERLPNMIDGEYEKASDGSIKKGEIRLCIVAPKGYKIIVADFSQIEARLLAYNARQMNLVEDFQHNVDIYSRFIEPYYGRPISKKTPAERGVGKQLILSCGYMSGAKTIKTTAALGSYGPAVHLSLEEAEGLKTYYRSRNQGIVSYWNIADQMIGILARSESADWGPARIQGGRLWGPNGTWLDYTTLHQVQAGDDEPEWKKRTPQWAMKTKNGIERVHKGVVTAHITSYLARIIMTEAMKRVAPYFKIALTVYDEIVACVPEHEAEQCKAFMEQTMVEPLSWAPGLPLAVEAHISDVYDK